MRGLSASLPPRAPLHPPSAAPPGPFKTLEFLKIAPAARGRTLACFLNSEFLKFGPTLYIYVLYFDVTRNNIDVRRFARTVAPSVPAPRPLRMPPSARSS